MSSCTLKLELLLRSTAACLHKSLLPHTRLRGMHALSECDGRVPRYAQSSRKMGAV